MREQGRCMHCNYPIERERWERPTSYSTDVLLIHVKDEYLPELLQSLPYTNYKREQWYKYFANGREITLCPSCQGMLVEGAHS